MNKLSLRRFHSNFEYRVIEFKNLGPTAALAKQQLSSELKDKTSKLSTSLHNLLLLPIKSNEIFKNPTTTYIDTHTSQWLHLFPSVALTPCCLVAGEKLGGKVGGGGGKKWCGRKGGTKRAERTDSFPASSS